ncbi:MAG: histidine phosphatase family protein [Deltaproteobacteria bacterium]|nr:histidine phosphatase family protein [Deltaproteobacteria bacterium]
MSTLYLIRHGQASYTSSEPPLSELGNQQAHALGRWAAERGFGLDAVYQGPRLRQIDTARHYLTSLREGRGQLPPQPITQLDDFDEYHAQAILQACTPRLVQPGGEFDNLFASDSSEDRTAQRRRFNRFFDRAIELWLGGELHEEKVEPFLDFAARVARGVHEVMRRSGRGKRVAVFTSAGCISAALRLALGLDDATTLRMASVVLNTSITEFRFRSERDLTLVGFNAVPHLQDPAQIT